MPERNRETKRERERERKNKRETGAKCRENYCDEIVYALVNIRRGKSILLGVHDNATEGTLK